MSKEIINPPTMPKPTGYSFAVKKEGTPVFIAGQVAEDENGNVVGAGDINAQIEQVLKNLKTVVNEAGGSVDDIVRIGVYVTDLSYRPAVAAARLKFFSEHNYPASTFLVVQSLATPDFLVEIDAIAVI